MECAYVNFCALSWSSYCSATPLWCGWALVFYIMMTTLLTRLQKKLILPTFHVTAANIRMNCVYRRACPQCFGGKLDISLIIWRLLNQTPMTPGEKSCRNLFLRPWNQYYYLRRQHCFCLANLSVHWRYLGYWCEIRKWVTPTKGSLQCLWLKSFPFRLGCRPLSTICSCDCLLQDHHDLRTTGPGQWKCDSNCSC